MRLTRDLFAFETSGKLYAHVCELNAIRREDAIRKARQTARDATTRIIRRVAKPAV